MKLNQNNILKDNNINMFNNNYYLCLYNIEIIRNK